jgi:hypothetical protein
MKSFLALSLLMALPPGAVAQDAESIDALKKELRELRQRTEQLEEKLKRIETAPPATAISTNRANLPADQANAALQPTAEVSPNAPMTIFKGQNSYLNLSLDGLVAAGGSTANDIEALQPGGHDPSQRGFTIQNVEMTFEGAVDPYFRAQANIVLLMDPISETEIELEEAWMETTSLPGNLTVRGGQILTDFGRLNSTHPHSWSFVDSPLVNARFLGPDGLRNPGARLSWLTPTPFYSEVSLSVQNSAGETGHSFRSDHDGEAYLGRINTTRNVRGAGDLLYAARYYASFDITPSQTILAGASGAFGANASTQESDTQIYGVDLFWKWKPTNHSSGFPFVTWQTEGMLRHYQAGAFNGDINGDGVNDPAPQELLKDWGAYTQVSYGFKKGWVAAIRGDFVDRLHRGEYEMIYGDDPERAQRWRISPNLTWYPTEFSKIRLQYNLDERDDIGIDHSVWLQVEFLLGAHGAHKF